PVHIHLHFHSTTHSTITTHLFSFNHPPTPQIYTLSLHDALPIYIRPMSSIRSLKQQKKPATSPPWNRSQRRRGQSSGSRPPLARSEEHTSELQSRENLVCRLLLEKKKKK